MCVVATQFNYLCSYMRRFNLIHSSHSHNPASHCLSMPVWHTAEVPPLPTGIDIQYHSDYQR